MTDRQAGSVDVQVDIVFTPARRAGSVGVQIDYVYSASNTYLVTVTATQPQATALAGSAAVGRTLSQSLSTALRRQVQLSRAVSQSQTASLSVQRGIFVTRTVTQVQSATLGQTVSLTRPIVQAQQVGLAGIAMRVLTVAQSTSVRLIRQVYLGRTLSQSQAAIAAFGRGYQRTLTTSQSMTVRLTKSIRLMRRLTGTHVVQTSVRLGRQVGRVLRASQPTSVRLLKQVRFVRQLSQPQAAAFSGLPVQLRVVSTVQTRSLALGRNIFLTRLIAQGQALVLKSDLVLARTAVQPTLATLQRAVSRELTIQVAPIATLEWCNVTPRYDVLVIASVSQQVSLSSAGAGKTAKQFVVDTRRVEFVVGQRSRGFAVGRRGVRFTVEER